MADKLGTIKLLLGVGIVLMLGWFIVFSLAPAAILTSLAFIETEGYFLRIFGIFPLGWAVLFLFASKDVGKNLAIINGAIITGAFLIIAILVYAFTVNSALGWFNWLSTAVLFVFNLLLFIFKPKSV
ncbi:MAG: hypothetical protein WBF32_03930 [Candidatus Aminicenantaceae bacterium]|nr:hypothetical protein [Candidatus Heimdallarchaeota archaeon]